MITEMMMSPVVGLQRSPGAMMLAAGSASNKVLGGLQRASTMNVSEPNPIELVRSPKTRKVEESSQTTIYGTNGMRPGFSSMFALQSQRGFNTETDSVGAAEDENTSISYRLFAKQNLQNYEIINVYFEELLASPYEDNLASDILVGRWLEVVIPELNKDLMPLLQELACFRIDTSILDVYKNLLILISKRYDLVSKLVVG